MGTTAAVPRVAFHDYPGVLKTLDRYYDGLFRGDVDRLAAVFHPDAHYATASGGTLLRTPLSDWLGAVATRPSPAVTGDAYGYTVDSVLFAGPVTAVARLRCTMLGRAFTDLLTLTRLDGGWRIIAKTFHYDLLPES